MSSSSCGMALKGDVPVVTETPFIEETFIWSDEDEDCGTVNYRSPTDKKRIHVCPAESKPCVGMLLPTIDYAFDFNHRCSSLCRFDILRESDKRSSDGTIIRNCIYCNKQWSNATAALDTLQDGVAWRVRTVPSIMTGVYVWDHLVKKRIWRSLLHFSVHLRSHP